MTAAARTLTIGAIVGLGYSGHGLQPAVARAARLLREQEESDPSEFDTVEGLINIVCHMPGSVEGAWSVDFDGLRPGRFSAVKRKLVVDVALPADATQREIESLIADSLLDAIPIAEQTFLRKNVVADLSRAQRIAAAVASDLRQDP
jgi:hypothetical protein